MPNLDSSRREFEVVEEETYPVEGCVAVDILGHNLLLWPLSLQIEQLINPHS